VTQTGFSFDKEVRCLAYCKVRRPRTPIEASLTRCIAGIAYGTLIAMIRNLIGITVYLTSFVATVILLGADHQIVVAAVPQIVGALCAAWLVRDWWVVPTAIVGVAAICDFVPTGEASDGEGMPLLVSQLLIVPVVLLAFAIGRGLSTSSSSPKE
jgi:hypothetical protein